jgi:hypothetical protein
MDRELLQQMQVRTAMVAVAPSAVRGTNSAGVMPAARGFLGKMDLSVFGTDDLRQFSRQLNRQTKALTAALPSKERHFGLARKVLNLFLRECVYNAYLRVAYSLGLVEPFLELPLDSFTARGVRVRSLKGSVPTWFGVRKLTAEASKVYQLRAAELAAEEGLARVHLDLYYWMERE